jgi:hypothetical protein
VKAAGLVLVACAAGSVGCGAQTGFGSARVLDPGDAQIGWVLEGSVVAAKLGAESQVPLPLVQGGVAYRRGVVEGFELGARAWGIGITGFQAFGGAIDAKVHLARSGRTRVTLVSSLGYQQLRLGGTPCHVWSGTLPLLIGVDLGRHQLFLGPRVAYGLAASYGANTVGALWGGASIGFEWWWTKSLAVVPELVWMYSPVPFNGEYRDPDRTGAHALQIGLGGHFQL